MSNPKKESAFGAVQEFANALKNAFALSGSAGAEDQLKKPVADLLQRIGKVFSLEVQSQTEAQPEGLGARPDIAIYVSRLLCGYIELKQPGFGADPRKLKGEQNKKQWEKFQALPNLIYTDGNEFALYRNGERVGARVSLGDDLTRNGSSDINSSSSRQVELLFLDFLKWNPIVPHDPPQLAAFLAPLARLVRDDALAAVDLPGSAIRMLRDQWREVFFPDADDAQFADAYAQTLTYALLLARLSGASDLSPAEASKVLDRGNSVLAQTLRILGQQEACDEIRLGYSLLRRSLEALNPAVFQRVEQELWIYFYEHFLAAYDPKLRNDYGVYYTPVEVVKLQVKLASELLANKFGKKLGFADDGVTFLDPACGTGAYLLAAVQHGLERVRQHSGAGAIPARASQMARNMYGFEILVGPYAVSHLRLTQELSADGGLLPDGRLKIYLADTLESPFTEPPYILRLAERRLAEEHEAARKVKRQGEILVCIGNPPYDRQNIEFGDDLIRRKGGWVRYGEREKDGVAVQGEKPIFDDFLRPARDAGAGLHLKNLYNDYVYFWRWGLWRLFEAQDDGGILTFITASSYLAGPGFIGMREYMRRTFDELWIIDLGGDNLGTRKTPNVFAITVPVAIAIGKRSAKQRSDVPAKVLYTKIDAPTREEKLKVLSDASRFADFDWSECSDDWHSPFRPKGIGAYFDWPQLIDLFPYQRSGCMFGRSWPIAPTKEVLERRWSALMHAATDAQKKKLFHNNNYRKIENSYPSHIDGVALKKIEDLPVDAPIPRLERYAFRSFDRQWAICDNRFIDRIGAPLWLVSGPQQIYFTTLASHPTGLGPALISSSDVPDKHFFRGSFGGKDVIPLWRDAQGTDPNIADGLLGKLSSDYGKVVTAEDFATYVYALLGGQSYTKRFWNELETPGRRVPVTQNATLFDEAAVLGRRLIFLHTHGARFAAPGLSDIPQGNALCTVPISEKAESYPESFEHSAGDQELIVGDGRFAPVSDLIWNYEVSGLKVIESWLRYRMKAGYGRKSSPLDDIRPEHWTAQMTDELLELLWITEQSIALDEQLDSILDRVVAGPVYTSGELPEPLAAQRSAPAQSGESLVEDLFDDEREGASDLLA